MISRGCWRRRAQRKDNRYTEMKSATKAEVTTGDNIRTVMATVVEIDKTPPPTADAFTATNQDTDGMNVSRERRT